MTNSQSLAMLNKQIRREKDKADRYATLLYNTIIALEEERVFDTHNRMLKYLGMTEQEYKDIMGESVYDFNEQ